ncbi:formate dehydrogenase accessory sulfurtransferase FdhD [uncultured Sphingomonas sp.]|uniref:formate dehydrogenase accessory sulfurtransferase FdhD n=1 Tax=uncultured Sphingomonas sp. TaxID=158754 RepID=UPI0025D64A8B|nr:formate dehydrogenase accessory sulfurtransferase FdhD [uncultured Sphingomonas sp.]
MRRHVARETPIAIEINGLGYAVLMATPMHLRDLATGFLLAERLIDAVGDLIDVDEVEVARGVLLRVTLAADRIDRVAERVRHRISESSCGLCGIENLEQALRPLPRVVAASAATEAAIFAALHAIEAEQRLNRQTGAVHAAAVCAADGSIRLVREDVGRHNAFDKLIGAALQDGLAWDGGFALLTSRCSYELVEKAVLAGCPMLATISAPTDLALERAAEAGLALRTLARRDAYLEAVG